MPEKYTKLAITQWSEENRPREKMMAIGRKNLSNAEYLAILIGSGNATETAVDLAQRILHSVDNSLTQLSRLSVEELCEFKGIGPAKAINIIAAMELGSRRVASEDEGQALFFDSPEVIYKFMRPKFSGLQHEEMWCIYLNRNLKLIKAERHTTGGHHGVLVDNKMVFKRALDLKAANIIMSHNHPSGNLSPSKEDILLTHKIFRAAQLLDLVLMDHVIITENGFCSMNEQNLLQNG